SEDGKIYELETGASWNSSPITYSVTTGDMFPTGNQWDISLIRRLKLVTERLSESGATVKIYYQANTDADSGIAATFLDITAARADSATAGLAFMDITAALADSDTAGLAFFSQPGELLDMSVDKGLNRLIRITKDMNETAWCHAFKFEFTSSSSNKGFKPIMWGVQSSKIRTDI
ncbi:MAG: hypothetical protein ACERKJ_11870, partial [Candidatus Dadabacteria bacterium]